MPHFDITTKDTAYIAVENIVRKGEIAWNNVFYPVWHLLFIFNAL